MSENKIIKTNFKSLVDKFSQRDVISDIEKNYHNAPTAKFKVNEIDDNVYLKKAKLSESLLLKVSTSIKENGFKTPLILRRKKDHYEIVLGRKRLLACKQIGIEEIPGVVIKIDDEEMALMLLADVRDQREGNVIETALLCKQLCSNFSYSQTTLSKFIHQSRSQITNILRLLNLPDNIVKDISVGKLSYGHAKAIASLPESIILKVVDEIYKYNLSVRDVESMVQRYKSSSKEKNKDELRILKKYKASANIKRRSINLVFEREEDKNAFLLDIFDED